jgi:hypothetical protein
MNPVPAPDVERPRGRSNFDVAQVVVDDRTLLRIGGSQFENSGQAFLHRAIGVADVGVHIGHGSASILLSPRRRWSTISPDRCAVATRPPAGPIDQVGA